MEIPEIILASSSKYRRELLQRLIPSFRSLSPEVDESSFHSPTVSPDDLATQLAFEKASVIARQHPDALVIGSDQLVDIDDRVLGKPGTEEAAVSQLMVMTGRSHRLLTAVCVLGPNRQAATFINETVLHMRPLSRPEAERYVQRDQPLDCAGSYRIESLGIALFDRIDTDDFTAIMGLPLMQLSQVLRQFGIAVP